MKPFSEEDYMDMLSNPEERNRMPQTWEELERLLVLAMYHEEMKRKKLAAQLAMTLGDACSREMLIDVLRGAYQSATVSLAELQQNDVDCGTFSVSWQDKVCVLVPREKDVEAKVFADCGAEDGRLVVGKMLYQTVENTVFAFEAECGEEFSVFVYTSLKQTEVSRRYEHES